MIGYKSFTVHKKKKWKSILTIINIPCKYRRFWQKSSFDTNGINIIEGTNTTCPLPLFHCLCKSSSTSVITCDFLQFAMPKHLFLYLLDILAHCYIVFAFFRKQNDDQCFRAQSLLHPICAQVTTMFTSRTRISKIRPRFSKSLK